MNKTLSKTLQIAIPLGLGIFLIWYIFQQFTPTQLEETKQYFKNANYGFVVLSVVLSILSHISRAYRWSFMLEPLGYTPKLANNFMAISVAYLMNIFIPKSGEVTRGLILDKYENVHFEKGFGTIISERIIDLLFLMAFTLVALYLKYDVLYGYVISSFPPNLIYKLIIAFVVFLALVFLFLKFSKSKINNKIKNFVIGLKDGVLSIVTMKKKGPFIFHTFIIWGLYLLSFYVATKALEQTKTIEFGTIIIAFVVGSFTFAFTNSGFGTYPAAIAGILVLFSIPITVGTAFGWIVWTSNIASILIFGVLSLLLLPIYNRHRKSTPKQA
ncbi:MAG: lysylphosphatidylglycerol synthase transmembrane domain-containing protein [Patiriisocius sp.]|uniref:lysylphosphatidylglycerol synthase transmembrane domain-containing protein n=1 Tax=Patiriisocius sp. TaxID=2822396 RepID=UPI003EF2D2F4